MSNNTIQTDEGFIYNPHYQELSFISNIEARGQIRPIILLFVVDDSHSMRFYIDKKKTIQRQTLVQTAISIALNNPSIIRNGDYIGFMTFSTVVTTNQSTSAEPATMSPILFLQTWNFPNSLISPVEMT